MENDDNSEDMIAVGTTQKDNDYSDKPIMQVFKRLITNNNKQNILLTNAQIIDLLQKEFMLNTSELHELEVDIYMDIIKKFLKEWPLWDEIDRISKIKVKNGQEKINKYLHAKYEQMKNYLSAMLDIARPIAKDKVFEVENAMDLNPTGVSVEQEQEDVSDVILEIFCNRTQLNRLFYRRPHSKFNNTIFNVNTSLGPSTFFLEQPDYDAVLNWWNVSIIIKMPGLSLIRKTTHEVLHKLVNKKLNYKQKVTMINPYFQEKLAHLATAKKVYRADQTKDLKENFRRILDTRGSLTTTEYISKIKIIFGLIERDLEGLSDLSESTFYRKYYSNYPYARYLYTEVPIDEKNKNAKRYDLQLEETISPMYEIHIVKILPSSIDKAVKEIQCEEMGGIQLECRECSLKFRGLTMLQQLKQHIWENHFNEPDWECMNCNKIFSMVALARSRWHHNCEKKT